MGDRVCVLKDGVLQQVDTPTHLYEHPGSTFVASFIGSPGITLMENVSIVDGHAVLGEGHRMDLGITREAAAKAPGRVIAGIRPEAWELVPGDQAQDGATTVPLKVALVENLGSEIFLYCDAMMTADSGVSIRGKRVAVKVDKRMNVEPGTVVHARPRPGESVFFHPENEINLEYLEA